MALKNLNFVEESENEESAAALKNGVVETAVDITEGVLIGTNTDVMDDKTESAAVAALKNCVDDCICSDGESAAAALKNDVCETANAGGAAESADEALKNICVEVCICSSGEMNGMLEDSSKDNEQSAVALIKGAAEAANAGGAAEIYVEASQRLRRRSESESESESRSQSQSQNQSQSGNRQSQSQSQSRSRSQSQSQSRASRCWQEHGVGGSLRGSSRSGEGWLSRAPRRTGSCAPSSCCPCCSSSAASSTSSTTGCPAGSTSSAARAAT